MAFTSGFYEATLSGGVYTPAYDAADFAAKFSLYFTNGVFYNNSNRLQVLAGSGLSVNVAAGAANCKGYTTFNDAPVNITLNTANALNPRYDIIVLRLDLTNKTFNAVKITGTPSASPAIPTVSSLTRTSTVYDLMLAYVYVGAGATSVIQANIRDMRGDSGVCGFVTGTVDQISTATFWAQWQSRFDQYATTQETAFNTWFNNIRASLESLTTTQLINRQNTVEAKLNQLLTYYYVATGSADNTALVAKVKAFYDATGEYSGVGQNDKLFIFVMGNFVSSGVMDLRPTVESNRRVVLDFYQVPDQILFGIVYCRRCEIRGLKMLTYSTIGVSCSDSIIRDCDVTGVRTGQFQGIQGDNNKIIDCTVKGTTQTSYCGGIYGLQNDIENCTVESYSGQASAFGIRGTGNWKNNDVVVTSAATTGLGNALGAIALYAHEGKTIIIGGNARAYVIASSLTSGNPSECIGLYIAGSVVDANLVVFGLNLPNVVRSGYANYASLSTAAQARYNAAKINSGKYVFIGITAFKELSCYVKLPNWDLAKQFLVTAVSSAVGSTTAVNNANSFVNTLQNGYSGETVQYNTLISNITAGLT